MGFRDSQNFKSDTLASTMAAGATTATLSAGNFTAFTDGFLVVDYDNPAKREIIRCTVSGTAISSVTRAQQGTSDVEHTAGAKVIWSFNTAHLNQLSDGWILANEAWAYASATTITVPSGATARYSVGDKIKITQNSTVKYFYVTAVTSTLLTVTGGSDYTVANAAITENYYSKQVSPVGFPQWFAYTPSGVTACNLTGRFALVGRTVKGRMILQFTGAPNFNLMPLLPIVGSSDYAPIHGEYNGLSIASGNYLDFGVAYGVGFYGIFNSDRTRLDIYTSGSAKVTATNPITWASGDFISMNFDYYI